MGGVGSGRKCWSDEERIHCLRKKAVETTIQYLDSSAPLSERAKIAAQHSVREITDRKEELGGTSKVILVEVNKYQTPSENRIPELIPDEKPSLDAGKLT